MILWTEDQFPGTFSNWEMSHVIGAVKFKELLPFINAMQSTMICLPMQNKLFA